MNRETFIEKLVSHQTEQIEEYIMIKISELPHQLYKAGELEASRNLMECLVKADDNTNSVYIAQILEQYGLLLNVQIPSPYYEMDYNEYKATIDLNDVKITVNKNIINY